MATIKLRIECVQGIYLEEQCIRVIAVDDSESLLGLHELIQQAVSFDDDHLFDFYTANSASPRAEKDRLTDTEYWQERADEFEMIQLKNVWPLGRKKLYYRFDFGDEWLFEIRKLRATKADAQLDTPILLESHGPDPEQYPSFFEEE